MRDVVTCSAVRTAVGTFGGALAGTPLTGLVTGLATHVAVEAIGRANLQPSDVDQTVSPP